MTGPKGHGARRSRHAGARLTRRRLLQAAGGLLASGGIPGMAPARAAQNARTIRAVDLGIRPNINRDQTLKLAQAIETAAQQRAILLLPRGYIRIGELDVTGFAWLRGQNTRLEATSNARYILFALSGPVTLERIIFDGRGTGSMDGSALVNIERAKVSLLKSKILNAGGTGLYLDRCRGRVHKCTIRDVGDAALFSENGKELRITDNRISVCGNNGILVWQGSKRYDGSLVANNTIRNIRVDSGGDGPNGNGINVFKAGDVTVKGNRISKCGYTAVRNNSGDNCVIQGNQCTDLGEVAIFVEFAWRSAKVLNNTIRNASAGISTTNLDHGGRGALIRGNTVEDVHPRIPSADTLGYGISAEGDTVIDQNTVRRASQAGLSIGWGPYLRNVTASENRLVDCEVGVAVSVVDGAGTARIVNNTFVRPRNGAVVGFDHEDPVTGDLLEPGAQVPPNVVLSGNRVE